MSEKREFIEVTGAGRRGFVRTSEITHVRVGEDYVRVILRNTEAYDLADPDDIRLILGYDPLTEDREAKDRELDALGVPR